MEELESFVKDNIIVTVKSPVEVDKIKKVEADNAHLDMAINVVFRSEDGEVFPCYSSRNLDASEVIVLMLYYTQPKQSDDGEEGILHYALIPDPGLLLARRTKSKKGVHQSRRKHICFSCMNHFDRLESLQRHATWCNRGQMMVLPKPGMTIEYQRRSKEFKIAYVGFMDFETIQCEPTTPSCSCKSSDCQHKTKVIKVQKPVAYSLLILDRNGKMVEHITYAGEDASRHFLGELLRVEEVVMDLIDSVEPMVLTAQQEREFQAATVCYLCHEPFGDPANYKCRDHDHLDGKYLGASHSICNLHRSEVRKLPIFCHNF